MNPVYYLIESIIKRFLNKIFKTECLKLDNISLFETNATFKDLVLDELLFARLNIDKYFTFLSGGVEELLVEYNLSENNFNLNFTNIYFKVLVNEKNIKEIINGKNNNKSPNLKNYNEFNVDNSNEIEKDDSSLISKKLFNYISFLSNINISLKDITLMVYFDFEKIFIQITLIIDSVEFKNITNLNNFIESSIESTYNIINKKDSLSDIKSINIKLNNINIGIISINKKDDIKIHTLDKINNLILEKHYNIDNIIHMSVDLDIIVKNYDFNKLSKNTVIEFEKKIFSNAYSSNNNIEDNNANYTYSFSNKFTSNDNSITDFSKINKEDANNIRLKKNMVSMSSNNYGSYQQSTNNLYINKSNKINLDNNYGKIKYIDKNIQSKNLLLWELDYNIGINLNIDKIDINLNKRSISSILKLISCYNIILYTNEFKKRNRHLKLISCINKIKKLRDNVDTNIKNLSETLKKDESTVISINHNKSNNYNKFYNKDKNNMLGANFKSLINMIDKSKSIEYFDKVLANNFKTKFLLNTKSIRDNKVNIITDESDIIMYAQLQGIEFIIISCYIFLTLIKFGYINYSRINIYFLELLIYNLKKRFFSKSDIDLLHSLIFSYLNTNNDKKYGMNIFNSKNSTDFNSFKTSYYNNSNNSYLKSISNYMMSLDNILEVKNKNENIRIKDIIFFIIRKFVDIKYKLLRKQKEYKEDYINFKLNINKISLELKNSFNLYKDNYSKDYKKYYMSSEDKLRFRENKDKIFLLKNILYLRCKYCTCKHNHTHVNDNKDYDNIKNNSEKNNNIYNDIFDNYPSIKYINEALENNTLFKLDIDNTNLNIFANNFIDNNSQYESNNEYDGLEYNESINNTNDNNKYYNNVKNNKINFYKLNINKIEIYEPKFIIKKNLFIQESLMNKDNNYNNKNSQTIKSSIPILKIDCNTTFEIYTINNKIVDSYTNIPFVYVCLDPYSIYLFAYFLEEIKHKKDKFINDLTGRSQKDIEILIDNLNKNDEFNLINSKDILKENNNNNNNNNNNINTANINNKNKVNKPRPNNKNQINKINKFFKKINITFDHVVINFNYTFYLQPCPFKKSIVISLTNLKLNYIELNNTLSIKSKDLVLGTINQKYLEGFLNFENQLMLEYTLVSISDIDKRIEILNFINYKKIEYKLNSLYVNARKSDLEFIISYIEQLIFLFRSVPIMNLNKDNDNNNKNSNNEEHSDVNKSINNMSISDKSIENKDLKLNNNNYSDIKYIFAQTFVKYNVELKHFLYFKIDKLVINIGLEDDLYSNFKYNYVKAFKLSKRNKTYDNSNMSIYNKKLILAFENLNIYNSLYTNNDQTYLACIKKVKIIHNYNEKLLEDNKLTKDNNSLILEIDNTFDYLEEKSDKIQNEEDSNYIKNINYFNKSINFDINHIDLREIIKFNKNIDFSNNKKNNFEHNENKYNKENQSNLNFNILKIANKVNQKYSSSNNQKLNKPNNTTLENKRIFYNCLCIGYNKKNKKELITANLPETNFKLDPILINYLYNFINIIDEDLKKDIKFTKNRLSYKNSTLIFLFNIKKHKAKYHNDQVYKTIKQVNNNFKILIHSQMLNIICLYNLKPFININLNSLYITYSYILSKLLITSLVTKFKDIRSYPNVNKDILLGYTKHANNELFDSDDRKKPYICNIKFEFNFNENNIAINLYNPKFLFLNRLVQELLEYFYFIIVMEIINRTPDIYLNHSLIELYGTKYLKKTYLKNNKNQRSFKRKLIKKSIKHNKLNKKHSSKLNYISKRHPFSKKLTYQDNKRLLIKSNKSNLLNNIYRSYSENKINNKKINQKIINNNSKINEEIPALQFKLNIHNGEMHLAINSLKENEPLILSFNCIKVENSREINYFSNSMKTYSSKSSNYTFKKTNEDNSNCIYTSEDKSNTSITLENNKKYIKDYCFNSDGEDTCSVFDVLKKNYKSRISLIDDFKKIINITKIDVSIRILGASVVINNGKKLTKLIDFSKSQNTNNINNSCSNIFQSNSPKKLFKDNNYSNKKKIFNSENDNNNDNNIHTNDNKYNYNNIDNQLYLGDINAVIDTAKKTEFVNTTKIVVIIPYFKVKLYEDIYENILRILFENFNENMNIKSKNGLKYDAFLERYKNNINFKWLELGIFFDNLHANILNFNSNCINHVSNSNNNNQATSVPIHIPNYEKNNFCNVGNIELTKLGTLSIKNLYFNMRKFIDGSNEMHVNINYMNFLLNKLKNCFNKLLNLEVIKANNKIEQSFFNAKGNKINFNNFNINNIYTLQLNRNEDKILNEYQILNDNKIIENSNKRSALKIYINNNPSYGIKHNIIINNTKIEYNYIAITAIMNFFSRFFLYYQNKKVIIINHKETKQLYNLKNIFDKNNLKEDVLLINKVNNKNNKYVECINNTPNNNFIKEDDNLKTKNNKDYNQIYNQMVELNLEINNSCIALSSFKENIIDNYELLFYYDFKIILLNYGNGIIGPFENFREFNLYLKYIKFNEHVTNKYQRIKFSNYNLDKTDKYPNNINNENNSKYIFKLKKHNEFDYNRLNILDTNENENENEIKNKKENTLYNENNGIIISNSVNIVIRDKTYSYNSRLSKDDREFILVGEQSSLKSDKNFINENKIKNDNSNNNNYIEYLNNLFNKKTYIKLKYDIEYKDYKEEDYIYYSIKKHNQFAISEKDQTINKENQHNNSKFKLVLNIGHIYKINLLLDEHKKYSSEFNVEANNKKYNPSFNQIKFNSTLSFYINYISITITDSQFSSKLFRLEVNDTYLLYSNDNKTKHINLSNSLSKSNYKNIKDKFCNSNKNKYLETNCLINDINEEETIIKSLFKILYNDSSKSKWEPIIEPCPLYVNIRNSKNNYCLVIEIDNLVPVNLGLKNIIRQTYTHSLNINVNEIIIENLKNLMIDIDKFSFINNKQLNLPIDDYYKAKQNNFIKHNQSSNLKNDFQEKKLIIKNLTDFYLNIINEDDYQNKKTSDSDVISILVYKFFKDIELKEEILVSFHPLDIRNEIENIKKNSVLINNNNIDCKDKEKNSLFDNTTKNYTSKYCTTSPRLKLFKSLYNEKNRKSVNIINSRKYILN